MSSEGKISSVRVRAWRPYRVRWAIEACENRKSFAAKIWADASPGTFKDAARDGKPHRRPAHQPRPPRSRPRTDMMPLAVPCSRGPTCGAASGVVGPARGDGRDDTELLGLEMVSDRLARAARRQRTELGTSAPPSADGSREGVRRALGRQAPRRESAGPEAPAARRRAGASSLHVATTSATRSGHTRMVF